jgi:hypothetical protein
MGDHAFSLGRTRAARVNSQRASTLTCLKDGKRIADASIMKLFRAAEALLQEADPIAAARDRL